MLGSLRDISMLLLHCVGFNFYLFELFYGDWNAVIVKGYLYGLMSIITVYLALTTNSQINKVTKLTFAFNFALFFVTLLGIFKSGVYYMLLYNGAIIVVSAMVLTSALNHGYFKSKNEND